MASPLTATPIPAYTAIPDVPADLTAAVNNLEKFAIPRFATAVARDAAITAPVAGQMAYVTGTGYTTYTGSAWAALLPAIPPIASGSVTATFSAATDQSTPIVFPVGRFSNVPSVVATVTSTSGSTVGSTVRISSVTTSGCTLLVHLTAAGTLSVAVFWIAMDPVY